MRMHIERCCICRKPLFPPLPEILIDWPEVDKKHGKKRENKCFSCKELNMYQQIEGIPIVGVVYKKNGGKKVLNLTGIDKEGQFREINLSEKELPRIVSQWQAAGVSNLRLYKLQKI